jgi:hypothetical protein
MLFAIGYLLDVRPRWYSVVKVGVEENGWQARRGSKMKSSFVIVLSLLVAFLGCARTEPEIVIVPRGYTGYVTVIFGQKAGSEASYQDGWRVYVIPQNGVLLTQFAHNVGWGEWPKFYYENTSPENKIRGSIALEDVPLDTVRGMAGPSGSVLVRADPEEYVIFSQYFIGTRPQIEKAREAAVKVDIISSVKE